MIRRPSARRGGFTLLEVLLASALAIVLMAALYVALDVQLRLASAGRESIEQATLTRAIIMRLEADLSSGIGPVAPPIDNSAKNSARGSGMGGGTGGTGAGGAGGTGAGGATGSGGTSAGGTTGAGATTGSGGSDMGVITEEVTTDTIPFTAGVIGTADQLTIYAARVAGVGRDVDDSGEMPNPADARRVTYWLTDRGLARQERPWLTAEDVQTSADPVPEDGKEERDYVIAEEVTRLQFEYWDGSAWSDTWDGRETNADGKTLKGPPMAIRVHFWLRLPGDNPGETVEKEYRHTIAIRAAAGPATADTSTTQP
jgi:type II secretory pathway pseudopilin PulG